MMRSWNYQKMKSDCGLCALSNALLYKNIKFDYNMAESMLYKRGLELFEYRGFFFYLPLLLADLDIKSTLYLPKHDEVISALFVNDDVNISMLDYVIQKYEKSKNAMYFFFLSFRQILHEKDKIYITFDRLDLINELKDEKVILANIVAKEYYQLQGDNTNHVITLIPENRHYESIDPYKFMGYKEFSDWDKYLKNAQEYNWLKYKGFAVSF